MDFLNPLGEGGGVLKQSGLQFLYTLIHITFIIFNLKLKELHRIYKIEQKQFNFHILDVHKI